MFDDKDKEEVKVKDEVLLQTLEAWYKPIVARIRAEVVFIHDVHPGCGDSDTVATVGLEA